MSSAGHFLVSLEPRHAEGILDGSKRVELRKRTMHVAPQSIMWIYAKLPIGSVVGKAQIETTCIDSPGALWRTFGSVSGLSKAEFFSYFYGVHTGIALVLSEPVRLGKALKLDELRRQDKTFHPPQFFTRMSANHPILNAAGI